MTTLGIIGGTGLTSLDAWVETRSTVIETPYGTPSAPLAVGELCGRRVVFLPRHGADHTVPPHKINYRANIWALQKMDIAQIVAVAAVGGIDAATVPASLVIPDQLIDYTYGREHTFHENDSLDHVDFTEPYSPNLRRQLLDAAKHAKVPCVDGGVYGATQGPRLETAAEIKRLSRDGCTIVGMTGMPEAGLARELDLHYCCCALVVNWAAGCTQNKIDMAEIYRNVKAGQKKLQAVFNQLLNSVPD